MPVKYVKDDRINMFQVPRKSGRVVSDSYKTGDRNYKNAAATSPYMMTSGVSPSDKVKEMAST